jgi:hypothetical protein
MGVEIRRIIRKNINKLSSMLWPETLMASRKSKVHRMSRNRIKALVWEWNRTKLKRVVNVKRQNV